MKKCDMEAVKRCFESKEFADDCLKGLEMENPVLWSTFNIGRKMRLSENHVLKTTIVLLTVQKVELQEMSRAIAQELWELQAQGDKADMAKTPEPYIKKTRH